MVAHYYHADRTKDGFIEGMMLEVLSSSIATMDTSPRGRVYQYMFPNGVTAHGKNFLLTDSDRSRSQSYIGMIEILAEEIRRAHYPRRPSRMTSVFGCRTINEAKDFIFTYPSFSQDGVEQRQGDIWEIEGEVLFEGDMKLLSLGTYWLDALANLHAYWRGEKSDQPFIELLLNPPVRVIKKVRSFG